MPTMKCCDLGGPTTCEVEFTAGTWEQMQQLSMQHGSEMMEDPEHAAVMASMMVVMQNEASLNSWMQEKEAAFNALLPA